MSVEHKRHRWVFDYAEYDIVKGQGFVMGSFHYKCAYCPNTFVTEKSLENTELESDVIQR